jgi:hypothetical protein
LIEHQRAVGWTGLCIKEATRGGRSLVAYWSRSARWCVGTGAGNEASGAASPADRPLLADGRSVVPAENDAPGASRTERGLWAQCQSQPRRRQEVQRSAEVGHTRSTGKLGNTTHTLSLTLMWWCVYVLPMAVVRVGKFTGNTKTRGNTWSSTCPQSADRLAQDGQHVDANTGKGFRSTCPTCPCVGGMGVTSMKKPPEGGLCVDASIIS